ncbi:MAG: AAA family ATPase [Spirochaetales bacterium]|nr:AAA family ATPase [Spirochaetales bacterium]
MKIEKITERQCSYRGENASIWIGGFSGSIGTEIIYNRAGVDCKSLTEIKFLLSRFGGEESLCLPQVAAGSDNEIVLRYDNAPAFPLTGDKIQASDAETVIEIGIGAARALHEMQRNGLCHGEISPHFIFRRRDGSGYGLFFTANMPVLSWSDYLPYIAPERINQSRVSSSTVSDLYSLAVLMYSLLTGVYPCAGGVPEETIYRHLAVKPVPPVQLNTGIPVQLSTVICKLLEKDPEQRYHTAYGLLQDLLRLKQNIKAGMETEFIPGTRDRSPRLEFSGRIFGRDAEKERLYEIINHGNSSRYRIIKVSGNAGVGKTSLVNEIIPALRKRDGLILSGKCGQAEQNLPYHAVLEPFRALVHDYLKNSNEDLKSIRKKFSRRILKSAGVLSGIVPDIELLTGPLPDAEPLGPEEAKNRLMVCLFEFLRIIIGDNNPLTIFIDDLQWIDDSSLELLKEGLRQIIFPREMLLILAYRTEETEEQEAVMEFLRQSRQDIVLELYLDSLPGKAIRDFLSNLLSCTEAEASGLSEVLISKTGGNPFYMRMLLEKLQNENILSFNYDSQSWCWKTDSLQLCCGSENVIGFLVSEMKKLDDRQLELLNYAACLGDQFDSRCLSFILKISMMDIEMDLGEIVESGFIFRSDANEYEYKFSHDKIRQAAYSRVSGLDLKTLHLNIARKLNKRKVSGDKDLIQIVTHYNKASMLIDSRAEIALLTRMNIDAAVRAGEQSAWELCVILSNAAMRLFKEYRIDLEYSEKILLYRQCIESARLTGNYARMEMLIRESNTHVNNVIDKVLLEKETITALIAQNRRTEAVAAAEELLRSLEVRKILWPGLQVRRLYRKSEHYFTRLPSLKNQKVEAVIEILMMSFSAVYLSVPEKLDNLIFRTLSLSLKYGGSSSMPFILVMYGLILLKQPERRKYAIKFGRLGMELCQRQARKSLCSKVYFIYGCFLQHWSEPLENSIVTLRKGVSMGMESGNFEYAALSQNLMFFLNFASGKNLQSFLDDKEEKLNFISRTGYKRGRASILRTYGLIENLSGNTADKFLLFSSFAEEDRQLSKYIRVRDNSAAASFHTYKMIIHYHYDDYKTAIDYSDKAREFSSGLLGQFTYVWLIWYATLALLKWNYTEGAKFRMHEVRKNMKLLASFAGFAPGNNQHRLLLAKAELARCRNDVETAAWNYAQAVKCAGVNGFVQDQALANELAGGFYLSQGNAPQAETCLREAYILYRRWGAVRKFEQLELNYPFLRTNPIFGLSRESVIEQVAKIVDVSSVLSAARAISREIVPGDLIKAILKIVIQYSGAQRGILFLENENMITPVAVAGIKDGNLEVETSLQAQESDANLYSQEILDYTVRTLQPVILNGSPSEPEQFGIDYFKTGDSESILCMPLMHRSKLVGCIYLDNKLTRGVFSPARLELLKYLSGQISVSLENSRLYESLQQSYTALKQKEEQNKDQFQQLLQAEKMASLGILAASITHEVSNPNYAIHLNSEFLSGVKDEVFALLEDYSEDLDSLHIGGLSFNEFREKIPRVVDTILSCSQQIDSVIKELKRYVRREPDAAPEQLNINSIIESTITLCTGFIEKSTDRFSVDLATALPAVSGSRQKMQQALMNLIINACQSLPEKSRILRIESFYTQEDDAVKILIIDEGTGFSSSAEQMKKPFYSTKGSLGLGISISEEIIKMFEGSLKYRKNEYSGTTAVVSVPVSKERGNLL